MTIEYESIGVIRTPFATPSGMPRNPADAAGTQGTVEVDAAYTAGLRDLDGFSHLVLLFHFDRSDGYELELVPRGETQAHGVFATRSPRRPNAIGLSVVRLERVEGAVLHVRDVDMADGTPLLDIKPYLPSVDTRAGVRTGWLGDARPSGDGAGTDGPSG